VPRSRRSLRVSLPPWRASPEGYGYGPDSGGYDQLGFGTLAYTR
jgi:hypothetical protein